MDDLLFDSIERNELTPRGEAEPQFAFINRSVRPPVGKVRDLLEDWFSRFPNNATNREDSRKQLRGGIRNKDDHQFKAKFFELLIHELLLVTDHAVFVEAELPHVSGRPDFLARTPMAKEVIIEATVVTEASDDERSEKSLFDELLDQINRRVTSKDFNVDIELIGSLTTAPRYSTLCAQIQGWLNSLNYDEVATRDPGEPALSCKFQLPRQKTKLKVIVDAKSSTHRVIWGRTVLPPATSFWVNSWEAIKKSLDAKAKKYRGLGRPYIIAINCVSPQSDWEEFEEAIIGVDGLWPSIEHPIATRVSAVLACLQLDPFNVPRAGARLFHNPWAAFPYAGSLTALSQAYREPGGIRKVTGVNLGVLLGLDPQWPNP